jgi:hypothetical protein
LSRKPAGRGWYRRLSFGPVDSSVSSSLFNELLEHRTILPQRRVPRCSLPTPRVSSLTAPNRGARVAGCLR